MLQNATPHKQAVVCEHKVLFHISDLQDQRVELRDRGENLRSSQVTTFNDYWLAPTTTTEWTETGVSTLLPCSV